MEGRPNGLPRFLLHQVAVPTLYLLPIGESHMSLIEYEGERNVTQLLTFLGANGGVEFAIPELNQTQMKEQIAAYYLEDEKKNPSF
jgi:hypothetical protein